MEKLGLSAARGEVKMKFMAVMTVFLFLLSFAGVALAVPPGKTVEWDTPSGKVVFEGKVHAEKGFKCNDCHTKIFPMKKTTFTMADINAGKECGACHNGEKAFKASAPENCAKCHRK